MNEEKFLHASDVGLNKRNTEASPSEEGRECHFVVQYQLRIILVAASAVLLAVPEIKSLTYLVATIT